MKALLRKLFGYPSKSIGRERALQIAHSECERRGWPWTEPVRVREYFKRIGIQTNAAVRGGCAVIVINAFTGRVIKAARMLR